MKKLKRKSLGIFLAVITMCFCSCGNTAPRSLSEKISIPENGIIEESVFNQLKKDNSISIFTGESNGFKYEWTVFGSDISDPHKLNMAIDINKNSDDDSIEFEFKSTEKFGFSSMLSIYLDERWDAQSATAFSDDNGKLTSIGSVSITGKDTSILNISMSETYGKYIIKADEEQESETTATTTKITKSKSSATTKTTATSKSSTITETSTTTVQESITVTQANITTVKVTEQPIVEEEQEEYIDIPEDTEEYEEPEQEVETEPENSRIYSDGSQTEQDKFLTDPIPEGKPMPVEPSDANIDDSKIMVCTFSIECTTILNNISDLDPEKLDVVPSDGIILPQQTVEFKSGESVFDVLKRVCQENNIHMEYTDTPIYNSAYIEGINNLYEFDCGSLSGWQYRVNGWYPNYGCSRYQLAEGDVVEWRYTCDLGKDIGCDWLS